LKIAIMQPTYLPWMGYFDLMDQVNHFVVLDDVQFSKGSWQHRNRIKTPNGLEWLSIPVIVHGRLGQLITDVKVRVPLFWKDHLAKIEANYGGARFFGEIFRKLSEIYEKTAVSCSLVEINLGLLRWLTATLGIATPLVRSSTLLVNGRRTERLVAMCQALGATEYLSPLGAAAYLLDDLEHFKRGGIEVSFHNYTHPTYRQLHPLFLPFASALDLLFNEGAGALSIIRNGRGPTFSPNQVLQSTLARESESLHRPMVAQFQTRRD